jgi:hypothetical protein
VFIVVTTPAFEFFPRIGEVKEDLAVQAFIAQLAVERFAVSVSHGLPGSMNNG